MTALLPAAPPTPAPAPVLPVTGPAPAPRLFRTAHEPPPDRPGSRPGGADPRDGSAAEVRAGPAAAPVDAPEGLPGAGSAITALVRLVVEVFDDRRPLSHLDAHLAPAALRYWRAATEHRRLGSRGPARVPVRSPRRPRVRPGSPARFGRIHRCHPRPDVAEVAACLRFDDTARALVARFEADAAGRWRCTVLRLL